MCANDTATLSSGSTLLVTRSWGQQAADTLARWAFNWKASIAFRKPKPCSYRSGPRMPSTFACIKVAGATLEGRPQLNIFSVTLGKLLHFGQHYVSIRKKVKPRTAHLRRMKGQSWGLGEAQMHTVANGFVRGALEYCAVASRHTSTSSRGNSERSLTWPIAARPQPRQTP